MKRFFWLSILSFLLFQSNLELYGQLPEKYDVIMHRGYDDTLVEYDTSIPLSYLTQDCDRFEGVPNFEYFVRFNYKPFNQRLINDTTLMFRSDSVLITIRTKSVDSARFMEKYFSDSAYLNQCLGVDESILHPPTHQFSSITIQIDGEKLTTNTHFISNLYSPNLEYMNVYRT